MMMGSCDWAGIPKTCQPVDTRGQYNKVCLTTSRRPPCHSSIITQMQMGTVSNDMQLSTSAEQLFSKHDSLVKGHDFPVNPWSNANLLLTHFHLVSRNMNAQMDKLDILHLQSQNCIFWIITPPRKKFHIKIQFAMRKTYLFISWCCTLSHTVHRELHFQISCNLQP